MPRQRTCARIGKARSAFAAVILLACPASGEWLPALPGWDFQFPRDHDSHPGFKTEWWYFTGNLRAENGQDFGYQLTFFRQGVREPGSPASASRFVVDDVKFAHFAITEISGGRFHHSQRFSRGAFGEAGFGDGNRTAWIQDWTCERTGTNEFHLKANEGEVSLDLRLTSTKLPVIHGWNGASQKAEGQGRASHYYSLTRLATEGSITIGTKPLSVTGTSWFDHEWATNQLAADQKGWDWFSLHFDDGTELMLFQIRTDGKNRDPHSSGTFVFEDGSDLKIGNAGFELEAVAWWRSEETAAQYPLEWRLSARAIDLDVTVKARFKNQELTEKPFAYWEGAIEAEGLRNGKTVKAKGYLEMTGYAGKIIGLQAPAN